MRIAFDTNVLIDAIANRADYEAAQSLIMAVAAEKVSGVITANSITDIYYIAKKVVGDENARNGIWNLMTVFDVAPVDGEVCATALSVQMSDFEDAVLAVCAAKEEADYIVSRDQGFLKASGCPITVIEPSTLLGMIQEQNKDA